MFIDSHCIIFAYLLASCQLFTTVDKYSWVEKLV